MVKEKQHKKLTTIILFCLLGSVITIVNANLFEGEALSSNITLTLHPDQANAEGDLKATVGTNVECAGYGHGEIIAHPDVMAEEIRRFLAKDHGQADA